jgi:GGDEF domain-containing protein
VVEALLALVAAHPEGRILTVAGLSGPGGEHLAAQGYETVMIAPLPGERRLLGVLVLADREGIGGSFATICAEFAVMIVHASVGLALADSGKCTQDELVHNADVAMYVSKHGFSVDQREMQAAR